MRILSQKDFNTNYNKEEVGEFDFGTSPERNIKTEADEGGHGEAEQGGLVPPHAVL